MKSLLGLMPLTVWIRWWRMSPVCSVQSCNLFMACYFVVHKAVTTLISCGLKSKNVMIKICLAFLLLHVVKSLGSDLFFASSKDTAYPVLRASAQLLEDGNLDVRYRTWTLLKYFIFGV